MKNIDSAARSRFLRAAAWVFPATGIIGIFVGTYVYNSLAKGLILGGVAGLLASILTHILVEYLGSLGVNLLYGKRRPAWSDYERFEGQLNQARRYKSQKAYHQALVMVNDILKEGADLPEALYLKAQILWEGYQKGDLAKSSLARILEVLPDQRETLHRWAQTLMDEIDDAQP